MNLRKTTIFAAIVFAALPAISQDRDALDVQKARNAHVQGRRDLVDYPPDKFDLSGLPAYKPLQQVSGVIRRIQLHRGQPRGRELAGSVQEVPAWSEL